jgi:hypothetical protein
MVWFMIHQVMSVLSVLTENISTLGQTIFNGKPLEDQILSPSNL